MFQIQIQYPFPRPSIRLHTSSVVLCRSLQSDSVSLSICMTWVVPRRSHSFHIVWLERVYSWLFSLLSLFVSRSSSSHHNHGNTTAPSICFMFTLLATTFLRVCIFCHTLLTAPFTSNLDAPSGCLGGMCSLLPPIPTCRCPQASSSPSSFLSFLQDTLHGAPSTLPRGRCSCCGLSQVYGLIFGQNSTSEYIFSRCGLCGHRSLHIRPRRIRNSLGWRPWGNTPSLLLRRRPLTTLGRPLLPPSRSRIGVSRVRKPLAPARALLGRYHCGRSCCP
jgi:hypothetical protein